MINVAIVDDEKIIVESLKEKLQICFDEVRREMDLTGSMYDVCFQTFLCGEELIEKASEFQLVFLDVDMPGEDGFVVGERLKLLNHDCQIIMATSMVHRATEGYIISALRYVTKPFTNKCLKEAVTAFYNTLPGVGTIVAYKDRFRYDIKIREVVYFYSFDSDVLLVYRNRKYRMDSSLNEISKYLDKRLFYRVNRAYIVNCQFITAFKGAQIIVSGDTLNISRSRLKRFKVFYENIKNRNPEGNELL